MNEPLLAIPASAVAAAGRALTFTIAELTSTLQHPDLPPEPKKLVEEEIMNMMSANKCMFSALPVGDGAAKLAEALHALTKHLMIADGDHDISWASHQLNVGHIRQARAALAAWKEGA